jgi:hypothetical protein
VEKNAIGFRASSAMWFEVENKMIRFDLKPTFNCVGKSLFF